jgi:hypothetical protein
METNTWKSYSEYAIGKGNFGYSACVIDTVKMELKYIGFLNADQIESAQY